MAQVSNNVLAALLLLAVVISTASILSVMTFKQPKLTGAATTGTGLTNLSITETFSIKMVRNVSDFGTGAIASGQIYYIFSNSTNLNPGGGLPFNNGSEGNGTNYGLGTYVYPFVIENDGNDNTTCVQLTGTAAATFIGGDNPVFKTAAKDNETADGVSCEGTMATAWADVSGSPTTMCQQLHSNEARDELRIHWQIGIPDNAAAETKTNTITITALNSC